jgi:hypothetical protein
VYHAGVAREAGEEVMLPVVGTMFSKSLGWWRTWKLWQKVLAVAAATLLGLYLIGITVGNGNKNNEQAVARGTSTPKPTRTPQATQTTKPTRTPQATPPSAPPEIAILQGFCTVFLDAWTNDEWTDCQGVIQNIGQRTLVDMHAGLGFDAYQTQGRTVDTNGHVNSSGILFSYKNGKQQSIAGTQSELPPGQQLTWHLASA